MDKNNTLSAQKLMSKLKTEMEDCLEVPIVGANRTDFIMWLSKRENLGKNWVYQLQWYMTYTWIHIYLRFYTLWFDKI